MPRTKLPEGDKVLPSTWAFKVKRYPDGRLRKFKARFVARGDLQTEGVDYDEKYAPVVCWSTVRLVMTMAIHMGWKTKQIDFSNAFVQSNLNEKVYLSLPPGFVDSDGTRKDTVLKLRKSLYGLVQAPMTWNNHLTETLGKLGYESEKSDPCMFIGHGVILLAYLDDILVFGPDEKHIDKALKDIKTTKLSFTEEDDVYAFLGVQVERSEDGQITLKQSGLIEKVIRATGLQDANSKATPAEGSPLGSDLDGEDMVEDWNYASVIGMLMYLASNSRPDIQFSVHQCARFTHSPKQKHANAVKRIVRYLLGTKTEGMTFTPDKDMRLDCYVDADYARLWRHEDDQDPVCVKSRTGYVMTLGGCPLVWSSKLQVEIALSTLEAEYVAISMAMRELLPLRRMLKEVGNYIGKDWGDKAMLHSTVYEDNNGALILAQSPKMTPMTKHIAVKYHWFRDQIGEEKGIVLEKIDSEYQKADIFTKGLTAVVFKRI